MVNILPVINAFTTIMTFLQGIVSEIAPIVHKLIDKKSTQAAQTFATSNCQPPVCGTPPYDCPVDQLSPQCYQRKPTVPYYHQQHNPKIELSTANDSENLDNSSKSISSSSLVMLVFVVVIVLAVIGFLFCRYKNQRDYDEIDNYRKSSIWSI